MKPSRVRRVVQLLTTLQNDRSYTTAELSKMFGVSRRTMFRDLKELQNIGIQPKFSSSRHGYQINSEQFLPPINLNLQEALSLLMLVHKMRNQIQLPFKKSALLAAIKIESGLPPKVRRYCEHALAKISAKASPQAPPPNTPGLDEIFATLQSSLALRHKVQMSYNSLFDGRVIDCVLSPYHLFYNQRAWYILGHSSLHKTTRTFKLNRIQKAELLDDEYEADKDFDLTEYIGRAWSMIPEGKIYHVRLCFSPKVANNVSEVNWHETQKVTRKHDGSAILEFRVDGLGEIMWWIMGYADQVEVLAPAQLRCRVAEMGRRIADLNNGSYISK